MKNFRTTDTLTEKEIATIQKVIREQLDVRADQLTPQASLKADLGADSLDIVEISMRLEEEFSLTIPDEAAEGLDTMEDIYAAVARLLGR